MCFSATASFGAGIVLTAIGVVSIKKVQQRDQVMFASIPLLFGAQQITEGFVWLSFTHPALNCIQNLLACIFIFFAQVIWPTWVPLSMALLEHDEKRKKIDRAMVVVGILVSLILAYCLFTYTIRPKIIAHHILYHQEYPHHFFRITGLFYLIATLVPPFLSSVKNMRGLGIMVLISCIFTSVLYRAYFLSVWCFFASLISICIVVIMHQLTKTKIATW
jgi:hypothetical protein